MRNHPQASPLKTAGLMTVVVFLAAACAKQSSGQSQVSATPPPPGTAPEGGAAAPAPPAILTQPLNQLCAPIALYPDPLIAIILPASANAGQVSAAATYLSNGGDPNATQSQPWDDSVRSLAHYPQLVQWMAQNMPWTQQLGAAFASDPSAVMASIQSLRAAAQSSGALTSTPQQTVAQDDGSIEIEPASDSEVYAPSYDPNLVYADGLYGYEGPFLAFSDPWPSGVWLDFGFDWHTRALWYGDAGYWRPGSHWGGGAPAGVRTWHPAGPLPQRVAYGAASPQPMRGAPEAPHWRGASVTYTQERSEGPARTAPMPQEAGRPGPAPDMRDHGPFGEHPGDRPVEGRPPAPGIERHELQAHHEREPEHRAPSSDGHRDRDHP